MKSLLLIGACLWLSAAIGGYLYLTRFENTPDDSTAAYPGAVPPESGLELDPTRPTLIFFAHPKCPCTRASLHELARLMTDTAGKLNAFVVFIKPKDAPADWAETDTRATAESIRGVRVVIDEDERETKIFNAQTSGTALLYDRGGRLRFNGGITSARGHEGDNAGRNAIFEIVSADDATQTGASPVFGCPLYKKDCPGELTPAANETNVR